MIITNFDKKMFKYNDENVFKEQSLINKKLPFLLIIGISNRDFYLQKKKKILLKDYHICNKFRPLTN
ncbi:hypothetical protein FPS14_contig00025-0024 [Flavobacterium psychrophilum]|nr:hypothetical protein FPS14_contig00025-0024 [Flavobacterium psychrophilum]